MRVQGLCTSILSNSIEALVLKLLGAINKAWEVAAFSPLLRCWSPSSNGNHVGLQQDSLNARPLFCVSELIEEGTTSTLSVGRAFRPPQAIHSTSGHLAEGCKGIVFCRAKTILHKSEVSFPRVAQCTSVTYIRRHGA